MLLITMVMGCQVSPSPNPVSESTQAIVGGTEATACQWPSAVMLLGPWVCTGTLVHPRAVVTAKHCLMNDGQTMVLPPAMVGLGESRSRWAKTVDVSGCLVHPDKDIDIGLCLLAEDVTDIPIVPVMAPCEASELRPGKPIVEVGFGVTSATSTVAGPKKWINGTIEHLSADSADIFVTTGSQDGEYFGDSGGPLFFRMPDQTWRLAGEDCCSDDIGDAGPRISRYTSVPALVSWLEEQSGLDLTPCHDQAGWSPDATCVGFPTNPGAGVGDWATLCRGETLVRQPTCAASPYDAGPRRDAREAGGQDVSIDVARDARAQDVAWGDGFDGLADSPDSQTDERDEDGPLPEGDAAVEAKDTGTDTNTPPDSAIDQSRAPGDAGTNTFDAGAHDASFDRASPDGPRRADATASDGNGRGGDSAIDRRGLTIRQVGCACRNGGSGPADGWAVLVSFGLVWAAGRSLRGRRAQRPSRYLQ